VTQWRSLVLERESGEGVIEYALVLALVAAGLLIALLLLRDSIGSAYDRVAHRVEAPGATTGSETGAVSSERNGGAKSAAKAEPTGRKEH